MEKIKKTLFFAVLTVLAMLIITGAAFTLAQPAQNTVKQGETKMDKNILITYFSWGGNTRYIAQKIQEKTGGDLFEIETVNPYPSDYHKTTVVAKKEIQENILPELKEKKDVSSYDIIFVGTPAWWYTMAPAVRAFLETGDFKDKTIVPFITHGGGGEYSIAKEMGQYAKGSRVLKSISIYNRGNSNTDTEIDNWLKELK